MPDLRPNHTLPDTPAHRPSATRDFHLHPGYNPVVLFALIAIVVLGVITQVSLRQIHQRQQQLVQHHLESSLNALNKLLATWHQQHVASIQVIADSPRGRAAIQAVLANGGNNPASRSELESFLLPLMLPLGYDGYSVFTAERLVIAATSPAYIGQYVQIAEIAEVMDRALAGNPAISRPMVAEKTIDGPRGQQPVGTLFQMMCVTLQSQSQQLDGYFCFRFDPASVFFPIFASATTGETGEVYAIDQDGNIITPSRFAAHLKSLKLDLKPHLPARVPDESSAEGRLTLAARQLLAGREFVSNDVYLDYRGVEVVGAARWLDEMNIGLISEQDYAEAFAPYTTARDVILALSFSGALLLMLLCATSVLNRRALVQRETRFRSLLENLPTPVYMKSLDGRFTVLNSSFCQLVKANRAELLQAEAPGPLMPHWLAPVFAGDTHVQPPFDVHTLTLELTHPSGQVRFYRLVRFPVLTRRSDWPQAMATVIINDTDRVQAERQLAAINTQLEQLVDERTRELWQAKETAVAASKTKAEFLANMSHEIRTPLNAVLGLAHLSLAEAVPVKVRTYLEKIQASGKHLLQVINDILDFSRIEAGKMALDQRAFNLSQLLDSVVNLLWDRAYAKGLSLLVSRTPEVPETLLGDPLRLGQILINFTANAVKFTERGQVTLSVRTIPQDADPAQLEFAVEDTGIGMSPEQIAGLFQPFHQVDSSSRRRFQGSGLGLTISKNLAELMEGTVSVTSTKGAGSRFSLRLPLRTAEAAEAGAAKPKTALPKVSGEVLVVEDDSLNREIAESLLHACGAKATAAPDGYAALEALAQRRFDLVLMDIQMPGMDGFETTARIRTRPELAQLPIVAITANAMPGDRERCLAGGMNDYLTKPLDPQQLHQMLVLWLSPTPTVTTAAAGSDSNTRFDSLQQAGVNTRLALERLLGNADLYHRLVERFVGERGDLPERLNQTLHDGRRDALRDQVHGLKSVAGTLGLERLAQMAATTEKVLMLEDQNLRLDELTLQFRQDLTLLRAWLQEADARIPSTP